MFSRAKLDENCLPSSDNSEIGPSFCNFFNDSRGASIIGLPIFQFGISLLIVNTSTKKVQMV